MPGLSNPSLELRAGVLRLALRPDLGGCIAGLWHGDVPILRSTEPGRLATSRASACYPLLPYSNRLAYRRFTWEGRDYTTQPNFDDSPHSVHGVGWLRPWEVVTHAADAAELRYRHPGDADWPFPFEATQRFTLTADGLQVGLSLVNTAPVAQPVGLGWHPYFTKRAASHLHIDVTHRWDADAAELPVRRVEQHGIDAAVDALDFDNGFDGWRGPALIRDERFSMRLTSPLDRLVIYTPRTKPYFCVEPVSHLADAVHRSDPAAFGLVTVAPGDALEASMALAIESGEAAPDRIASGGAWPA